jgi:hypothetical protein
MLDVLVGIPSLIAPDLILCRVELSNSCGDSVAATGPPPAQTASKYRHRHALHNARSMGHHFFITVSSSVTSIGNSPFTSLPHDGVRQCECRLAAKANERSLGGVFPRKAFCNSRPHPSPRNESLAGLETLQIMPSKIRESGLTETSNAWVGVWGREQYSQFTLAPQSKQHSHASIGPRISGVCLSLRKDFARCLV